jgi:uncharacterized protein (TIGR00299 family) protein
MRIAYLDCFAGISGDMILGALIDAGVDPKILHEATASLNIGASLNIEKVDRSGISSTKVHVLDQISPPKNHDSTAPHHHGRHLSAIKKIIQAANLSSEVKEKSILTFELLGASEAKIHNLPIEKIHFHEVGALDAIVDIVASTAGLHALHIDHWFSSPLNVGGGMIDCAHGRFPVPAPATSDLLRGLPTYSANVEEELVTPTGAALIRMLAPTFGQQPAMRVQQIGYGAGTYNPKNFPNVLRLSIGETDESLQTTDTVTILETALDDLNPQIIAHVAQQALQQGALDVLCTPTQMKKGRPGTLITILCDPEKSAALQQLLFRETTTLGIRIRQEQRIILTRAFATVSTPYGEIRIKTGSLEGTQTNATPEFEDCRAAAAKHNVPLKQVIQSALTTYLAGKAK